MKNGKSFLTVVTIILVVFLAVTVYGLYATSGKLNQNSSTVVDLDEDNLLNAENPQTDNENAEYLSGGTEAAEDTASDSSNADMENANELSSAETLNEETTEEQEEEDSMFSNRDLKQEVDFSDATVLSLAVGEDTYITAEGTYIISGDVSETSIIVDAAEAKVQLVLNGVNITNTDSAAIYVKNADKVFVTTSEGTQNTLTVNGVFAADGENNVDGVIYSKDDLTLNGLGYLTINSTANGVACKDELKITGGNYTVNSLEDAFEANDAIMVCDGIFTIDSSKDGLNAGNDEDSSIGYVYISGGTFDINASRQGIQATTTVTVDGGSLTINAAEGIEATYIIINDGNIDISASDDGMNATSLSYYYDVMIEINGGNITIVMGSGDTDALDANGSMVINGGYLDITATSSFDYDVSGTLNGGTVIVNGSQVYELTPSMGGGHGGMGGGRGDRMW